MRRATHSIVAVLAFAVLWAPTTHLAAEEAAGPPSAGDTIRVDVNGLVCDFCARALERVLKREEAVHDIDVDLDEKVVTIHLKEEADLEDERVQALIKKSGYDVRAIHRGE